MSKLFSVTIWVFSAFFLDLFAFNISSVSNGEKCLENITKWGKQRIWHQLLGLLMGKELSLYPAR